LTIGEHHAFTLDVSLGGFSVELTHVLPPGVGTEGKLFIGTEELPFEGVVRWAKPGNPSIGLRGRMGVRFGGISNQGRSALEGLLTRSRSLA
jgi:hypothetical protein